MFIDFCIEMSWFSYKRFSGSKISPSDPEGNGRTVTENAKTVTITTTTTTTTTTTST